VDQRGHGILKEGRQAISLVANSNHGQTAFSLNRLFIYYFHYYYSNIQPLSVYTLYFIVVSQITNHNSH